MKKPIDIVIEWYNNLQEPYKTDLAFYLLYLVPDYDSSKLLFPASASLELIKWLQSSNYASKIGGKIICVRGIIDFILRSQTSKENSWQKFFLFCRKQAEEENKPEFIKYIDEKMNQSSEILQEWEKIKSSWQAIQSCLNDDQIIQFYFP